MRRVLLLMRFALFVVLFAACASPAGPRVEPSLPPAAIVANEVPSAEPTLLTSFVAIPAEGRLRVAFRGTDARGMDGVREGDALHYWHAGRYRSAPIAEVACVHECDGQLCEAFLDAPSLPSRPTLAWRACGACPDGTQCVGSLCRPASHGATAAPDEARLRDYAGMHDPRALARHPFDLDGDGRADAVLYEREAESWDGIEWMVAERDLNEPTWWWVRAYDETC